jgi:hypothetical protein
MQSPLYYLSLQDVSGDHQSLFFHLVDLIPQMPINQPGKLVPAPGGSTQAQHEPAINSRQRFLEGPGGAPVAFITDQEADVGPAHL